MHSPKECWFDHERLEVYQEAIAFIAWLSALLDGTVRIGEVKGQLDRASTSIPLNSSSLATGPRQGWAAGSDRFCPRSAHLPQVIEIKEVTKDVFYYCQIHKLTQISQGLQELTASNSREMCGT